MKAKRVSCQTLGCKTNHYETDAIRMQFLAAGYEWVPFSEPADVYLVNTCTVTAEADRKSRQMLRRARKHNPDALVVAIGCQVEIGDAANWADLTINNRQKGDVCRIVSTHLSTGEDRSVDQMVKDADPDHAVYNELGPVMDQTETRALVKIEDGCNQFCSYCAIPFARGRVRSRSRDEIIRETTALAEHGFQEIVLTGIHICSFGSDLGQAPHALSELALDLSAIPGIARIRLGSLEPGYITPEFVRLAVQNKSLCPHFHLSLQSGSDDILEKMNRSYRTDVFRTTVQMLRSNFDDPAITTDVIVGFPGETDEHFRESLSFCREMAFSRMHVFRYSERRGTAAARMKEQVPSTIRAARCQEMMALADELAALYQQRQIGRILDVIVEQSLEDGRLEGYSANYLPVRFDSPVPLVKGDRTTVRILNRTAEFLLGTQTGPVFHAMIGTSS